MMLLSTILFGDKTATRVHLRWLPFVEHIDDLRRYSWGFAVLSCRAGYSSGFQPLDLIGLTPSSGSWPPGVGGICPPSTRRSHE
ncbi:hypothetical protein PIB30_051715 [Stylosanthes scabra]|uniref:Aminotransferase-like plant mobile domain-containing protein n=1 Tax=Stylosanthes scabra TaxID=79078 RepID=A0ABU6QHX1_9FABA|nr:hypothetical protein [Stylosanthes scabra]